MEQRRSPGLRVLAILATCALTASAVYAFASVGEAVKPHCERTLTRDRWETHDYDIAKRVVRCHQLDARSSDEVRALIGRPYEHYGGLWRYNAGGDVVPHDLVVTFDERNRVQQTDIEVQAYVPD
jgi:hypothetical protein